MTQTVDTGTASDKPAVEMVNLTIDKVEVSVPKGTLVIRAAELIGVQIPKSMEDSRGSMGDELGGAGGNAVRGGPARVQSDPGCSKVVVWAGRAAREAVDAVGESLHLAHGSEPCERTSVSARGSSLGGAHHPPLVSTNGGDLWEL